ncbi:hypothetical protein ACIBQX_19425 [Nonomuraea sp. NPDC049714]|uniref:hypothetical protein n=1 Tax=Nonomuraea sp. NPDC049714 TaxID=3364357 RepID=UPI0037A16E73
MWRELFRAGPRAEHAPAEERRAVLEPVATQPLLGTMLKGIAALRAKGRVTWGQPVFHPFDVEIHGDRAALHDCQDLRNAGQTDYRTGKTLNRGMANIHMVAAFSKEKDGMWRVVQMQRLTAPCSPAA